MENKTEKFNARLNQPQRNFPKWLASAFLVISFLGLGDAIFLTIKYYQGLAMGCIAPGSCDKVTASQYAAIDNVPVALMGAIYYFIVFGSILIYFWLSKRENVSPDNKGKFTEKIMDFLPYFTVIGFLASVWFVYLQLFVINAICIYCIISAVSSTILFALGILIMKINNSGKIIE